MEPEAAWPEEAPIEVPTPLQEHEEFPAPALEEELLETPREPAPSAFQEAMDEAEPMMAMEEVTPLEEETPPSAPTLAAEEGLLAPEAPEVEEAVTPVTAPFQEHPEAFPEGEAPVSPVEEAPLAAPIPETEGALQETEPLMEAADEAGAAEPIPAEAEATAPSPEEEDIPAWLRMIEEEDEGEVVTEAEIPEWEYVEDLDTSAAEEPAPAVEAPTEAPVTPPAAQVVEAPEEPEEAPEAPVAEEAVQEEAPPQEEPVQETPSAVEETAPLDPQLLEAWLQQLEQERAEREDEEEALPVAEAGFAETPVPVSEGPSEPAPAPSPTIEQRTLPDTPEARMIQEAREALDKNDLERALSLYRKVMRKKRYLDVVIEDLYKAQYEHPMSVELLILLGDACARAGRLQEAMDTYWKAEQLVR